MALRPIYTITKILEFRGFDSSKILVEKRWSVQAHRREFPGKFELSNLSRDNLSREIGVFVPLRGKPHGKPISDASSYRLRVGRLEVHQGWSSRGDWPYPGRGGDTVGNPHRAQIYRFELFELIPLFKVDKQFPLEQFEAMVSQSTVPCPPLNITMFDYSL